MAGFSFGITNGIPNPLPFYESAADPAAIANTGQVYTKETGGLTELFYEDDAGNVTQLTGAGGLLDLHNVSDAVTNAVSTAVTIRHTLTSGSIAASFGARMVWQASSGGTNTDIGYLNSYYQTVGAGTEDSAFSFWVLRNGTLAEAMRITGSAVTNNDTVMLGADGGTVSIVMIDDPDTGISWLGAGQLQILSDGVSSLTMDTNGAITINPAAGTLQDFNVLTDNGTQAIYIDVSANNIGIGTSTPTAGTFIDIVQPAATTGVPEAFVLTAGAHTGVTADSEVVDVLFDLSRTVTLADGTTIAAQRAFVIEAPTYAAAGATVLTETATLAITAAPSAGANVTITGANNYSLWCQAGTARLDGGLYVGLNGNVNDSVTPTDSMIQIVSDNTDAELIFFDSGNAGWGIGLDASDARAFVIGGDTGLGTSLAFRAVATTVGLYTAGTERLRIDNTSTAGQTALLLYDVDNATLERVTVGIGDSGGAGFKLLRIPN